MKKTKKELSLNDFMKMAIAADIYLSISGPATGLAAEADEVADKVEEVIRDKHCDFSHAETKHAIAEKISNVMWLCAVLSYYLGFTLEEICQMNYEKLKSRMERGKIHGSGDER